ncbi:stromelysin-3-like [Penaeus monodon]|uniref:stromelysin-3-like n=1 Tax=Penaeus monodon TaxID=6687 RepID=UPI0018A7E19C|nr:stromelysin-3-like [Penaeus monodon]XP_037802929.1 stromelysin-3-like [Penaeus monodon]
MGPLYVTFVCVALASLVAGVPVGIPFPRPSGDDPYAHRPHNEIAPDHVAPTLTPTATPKSTPRVGSTLHAVKFMQKFGYIPQGDEEADFLFSPGTLEASIKRMQKFGSIPQTGVIDNATIELMQTPRCGVPDVDADEIVKFRRPKRYIVGSEGWKKRELTYFLANWTPQLYSKENVQKELRRAFDAWSTYSHLDFKEVEAPDADIVIFFATYNHHDGYSFDGPSGILAHAYFPYEFGHYGGDVHFDESEKWTIKPKDEYAGLDFFTVAVHEIGHSLGLAHSPVADSIMFPYYKGYTPHFSLAYDDVMAMWELYIKRKLEGDDEYFNRTTTTTTTTPSPPTTDEDHQSDAANDGDDGEGDDVHRRDDERKRTDEEDFYEEDRKRREEEERRREEDRKRRREDEEEKRRWEEEVRRREEEARRREEEERWRWEHGEDEPVSTTERPPPPVPSLCDGDFDSMAVLRQELFIFKDTYIWRYDERGNLRDSYPSLVHNLFSGLPSYMKRVDAAYERPSDGNILFFIGKYYYVHNGDRLVEGSPLPLTSLGLPERLTKIDAAFYWPRAKKTYFFSRHEYFRYNEKTNTMDQGYPKNMAKWNGLPDNLDAVFTWKDGMSYFVKGKDYWKYDNVKIRPYKDYPQNAVEYWAGCSSSSSWAP